MKTFKTIGILVLLIAGGILCYKLLIKKEDVIDSAPSFEYVTLERKNVSNLVSSTGELAAREIVELGTQVSGTINEVYVDFNDKVEKGALLAVIDPSVLDAQVKGAKAGYLRALAQRKKAKMEFDRYEPIHKEGFLSDKDFLGYEIALEVADASLMDAEASLDRMNQNRKYAEIYAPISGIIIYRQVEKGQTVAASFNTPRLFIIAEDLGQMEIIANVDETDIGLIKEGQSVRYTVPAYPDDEFIGTVTQIRLQSKVMQNVVNYEVVVETENPDMKLLPGMTATLDFVVDEVQDVLAVPVSALNLRPNEEMMTVMKKMREDRIGKKGGIDGERVRRNGGSNGPSGRGDRPAMKQRSGPGVPSGAGGRGSKSGMLWYENDAGELKILRVRKGVSDGSYVEITAPRDENGVLQEGLKIIKKANGANAVANGDQGKSNRAGGSGGLRRLGF